MFAINNFHRIKYTSQIRNTIIVRTLYATTKIADDYKLKLEISKKTDKTQAFFKKFANDVVYSGYVESRRIMHNYKSTKNYGYRFKNPQEYIHRPIIAEPLPLTLKLLYDENKDNSEESFEKLESQANQKPTKTTIQFPFVKNQDIISKINFDNEPQQNEPTSKQYIDGTAATISQEIKTRLEILNKPIEQYSNWMKDYETFEGLNDLDDEVRVETESINYGTANPNVPVSHVPCSGCGALLHCKDTSIPGYIPSEIFLNADRSRSLRSVICQRCHFLKEYNLALQVNVTPRDYLKVLKTITTKRKALVILLVDLLDFPCSIWPGIADLLGKGRPVLVVGNKVDLLPQDGKGFLNRVTQALEKAMYEAGFGMKDIIDIGLISAKTGFGIENLVSRLFQAWQYKGDVFLVGCTNAGKSSLYNALLQSDYCKTRAAPLMQRATTSPWPGTTLHLLKFPITRPNYHKTNARYHRLQEAAKLGRAEEYLRREQFRKTKNQRYGSLIGHVDRTFKCVEGFHDGPSFELGRENIKESIGIDENHPDYKLGRWCYDTPGVVQPDQITDLLTTDELLLTCPQETIRPRTFTLRPGHSIFIAGLARLDYVNGPTDVTRSARFTVFASRHLPITVCKLECAEEVYRAGLESGALVVPSGNEESGGSMERLVVWKGLQKGGKGEVTVKGVDKEESCADIVLSSVGWIAITPGRPLDECTVVGWTPEGRGVHLREESLLSRAVSLRGKRIRGTVAYTNNKVYSGKI